MVSELGWFGMSFFFGRSMVWQEFMVSNHHFVIYSPFVDLKFDFFDTLLVGIGLHKCGGRVLEACLY